MWIFFLLSFLFIEDNMLRIVWQNKWVVLMLFNIAVTTKRIEGIDI